MDSVAESSTSSRSIAPVNLLRVLRCPNASDLARKPAIDRNPPKGKKRSRGEGVSDPKSVDPRKRVSEFPSESLSVKR